MSKFGNATALASQVPKRAAGPPDPYAAPAPFNQNPFDEKVSRPRVSTKKLPSSMAPGSRPKVSARGILIRDGSGVVMRRVPDFEQILDDMKKNKKKITLPERTIFLGAQMAATRELLSQPGLLPASVLTPGGPGAPARMVRLVRLVQLVRLAHRVRWAPPVQRGQWAALPLSGPVTILLRRAHKLDSSHQVAMLR